MSIHKKPPMVALTGALICTAIAIGAATADIPLPVIEISTFDDLCKIGNDDNYPLHGHYELVNDIDASASKTMNGGKGFEPIGAAKPDYGYIDLPAFMGVFDGGGHVIRGLYINRPDEFHVGLFARLGGMLYAPQRLFGIHVRNLGIEADSIIGRSRVGGLAGFATGYHGPADVAVQQAYITGCYVTGTVVALGRDVGGLVGENHGTITGSYAAAEVTGLRAGTNTNDDILPLMKTASVKKNQAVPPPYVNVGGLVGYNAGVIDSSYAAGNANGSMFAVGGLAGTNGGRITRSYATGSASSVYGIGVGGLVGILTSGEAGGFVENCYATGSATGEMNVGGLVGYTNGGYIHSSYSTGTVGIINDYLQNPPFPWGGLVGANVSTADVCAVYRSYWDITASGVSFDNVCSSEGKTTAEMKQRNTFVDWDFTDVWRINEGESYPYFAWQQVGPVSITYNNRTVRNHANQFMPQVSVKGRTLNIKPSSAQSSPQNLQIRVIDMRGKTVHSRVVNNSVNTLSLAKMPAGRYIVEVKNSGVRVGSVPVVVR